MAAGGSRVRIGRAVFEIGLEDKAFREGLQDSIKNSAKAEHSLRGIGQAVDLAVFRELATIGVQAVTKVTQAIGELAARGAEVNAMERSFDSLTASVGETSAEMLGTLRGATQGLVDDMTLMVASNKAILLGLPATAESMGTLAQTATILGRAMGQDAAKSLDDLTTALGRGSPLILDNLGLTVKVGEANEAYAAKLGTTAERLTEAEKKMAFYEAAMEAARSKVAELGDVQLTFGDRLTQAQVVLTNFRDELAKAVANSPVLAAGMRALSDAIEKAFGGDTQNAIDLSMGLIEGFAIALIQASRVGLELARTLSNAWGGLNVLFNGALMTLLNGMGKVVSGIGAVIEAHSVIPGIGGLYEEAGAKVRAMGDDLQHLAGGFAAQATAALNSAAETNAAYDKAAEILAGVQVSMEDARRASDGAGAAIAQTAVASRGAAEETLETSRMTAAEMKRQAEQRARDAAAANQLIVDTERRLQQELALSRAEGLQKELLDLEFKRQEELRSIESLKVGYFEQYTELEAFINQKYGAMKATAQATHHSIEAAAREQGFKTRAELEAMAVKAHETFKRMEASGLFTTRTLQAAWEAYENARQEATGGTAEFTLSSQEAITQGALQLFGVLGQRFKAAAIAGAIIATYSAVAKALASAPWPANLVLAAGALAAGMANVARIRSSDAGFAEGTPNLDYADFGDVQYRALHHQEAVIPKGGGHQLAAEIADALVPRIEMGGPKSEEMHVSIHVESINGSADPRQMADAFTEGLRRGGMSKFGSEIKRLVR